MNPKASWDYIIIGAGSAGCVLANRLSADPSRKVLLLEAGDGARSLWLRLPIGYFRTIYDPRFTWQFRTESQAETDGRSIVWPRGRVLGGSSAINGLLYIRGQHADYEDWVALGARGWGYRDVLPYFRKSERYEGGESEFHGASGELGVSDLRNHHPACEAWLQAGEQAGFERTDDFNGARDRGLGEYQLTLRGHWRCSAADAFLAPAMSRPNLRVLTAAQVTRILIEKGVAVGVEWRKDGIAQRGYADREVVLSAGAIQSPQILQLSGVGPASLLRAHGIKVLHDAPEVGANLQDHYQARVIVRLSKPVSLNDSVRNPLALAGMGIRWAWGKSGPLTVGAGQVGGMVATKHAVRGRPDVLFNVMPLSVDKPGDPLHRFSGFSASVTQCRPLSRGCIELASPDPFTPPRITTNYLREDRDVRTLVAGLQLLRDIYRQAAFRPWLAAGEYMPGDAVASDAELAAFARRAGGTVFHPCGTCRMGSDPHAVVDPELRVQGIEGLRVIDASVMPAMPSTNINAASIMIGERGAAFVAQAEAAGATST